MVSISLIMRNLNEVTVLKDTLAILDRQTVPFEFIVIDSGSTDGSKETLEAKKPAHMHCITPAEYIPGRVMNWGANAASGEVLVYLNANCVPCSEDWLENLVRVFEDKEVAAAYGRQIARSDACPLMAADYRRAFSDREETQWSNFFSMPNSALRRTVWAGRGFREDLYYSEDEDWATWARRAGHRVAYVPNAVVLHSRNYSLSQLLARRCGETRDHILIHDLRLFNLQTALIPLRLIRQILRDVYDCARMGEWRWIFFSPFYRSTEWYGRLKGLYLGPGRSGVSRQPRLDR